MIGVRKAIFPVLDIKARIPQVQNKFLFGCDTKRILYHSKYQQEDVLVNSIYIQGLESLANIAGILEEKEIVEWAQKQAILTRNNLIAKCWDDRMGLFWNLAGKKEEPIKVKTIISLMPLIVPGLPQEIVKKLIDHLTNPREFWAPYPVPSVAMDEPSFEEYSMVSGRRRIWRGPLSMNINWFLVKALRRLGYDNLADEIAEKSRLLVARHGFNEFFNPLNGMPAGANNFGWATLVVDM